MKQHTKIIAVFFLCCVLTACTAAPVETTPTAIPVVTKMSTATPTSVPISTAKSTPTRVPTITAEKKQVLAAELLSNTVKSELPGLWGLEPGKSKMETTLAFFYDLGWGIGKYSGFLGDVYTTGIDTDEFVIRIDFFGRDETLAATSFLLTHPILDGRDQWLSVQNILNEHESPDQIWVALNTGPADLDIIFQTGFDVYLFYKEPLVLIKYSGVAFREQENFSICLVPPVSGGDDRKSYTESVTVYSGTSKMGATPDELVRPFWVFPAETTVEEAFGITSQDLYDQIVIGQNLCFLTSDEVWKR